MAAIVYYVPLTPHAPSGCRRALALQLKTVYAERGSAFYPDGVTPIPGNENFGSSPHDPRVPVGFLDPNWAKLFGTENLQISTSPHEDAAFEASTAALETMDNGWTFVMGWGDTQYENSDQEAALVSLLNSSPNKIVRRTCSLGCAASHVEIYYKRITAVPSNIADTLKSSWTSTSNTMGTDFNLYSTYEDAVSGANAWTYCDYSDATTTMGFPGNCGPDGAVEGQWNLYQPRSGQADVAFFVEDASAAADARQLNEIEVIREAKLRSDPDKYLAEGGCYGLDKLFQRRACYRACHYMRYDFDEGTIKMCRYLMMIGSAAGSKTLAARREFVGEGLEKGGKIKSTHMLGNDEGLPNTGVY